MSGGALPAGMAPAVGQSATPQELAAGADFGLSQTAPQLSSGQLAMQGLMGALTGNKAYGQNAPAIHKALAGLAGMLGQQKSAGAATPPLTIRRMPAQAPGITQFTGITPQTGNVSPAFGGAPSVPSLAPWMMGGGM